MFIYTLLVLCTVKLIYSLGDYIIRVRIIMFAGFTYHDLKHREIGKALKR